MSRRDTCRRSAALLLMASLVLATVLAVSCRNEQPADDLDYLVWEVCRQIRAEDVTAYEVAGILQDASRHGAIMEHVEAECGEEIAARYP